jgi:flagellar FliL protein
VLLAILALVVGLAVGGLAGIFGVGPMLAQRLTVERLTPSSDSESPVESSKAWEPGVIYQLENLVVNPASSQGTRFLVVTLAVELDGPVSAAELERREAEARDLVLRVLGGKTVAELADIGARDSLKAELLETLASVVRVGEIRRLYLPQFVIQ